MGKKVKIILLIMASITAILVTVGNGCSLKMQGFELLPSSGNNDIQVQSSTQAVPPYPIIPGAKTVSVAYANQILDQMTSCVGVKSPSDMTVKMFTDKKGAVSTYGTPESMNPAMMMAVVSIAGEVCNDLIAQELSTGTRIFKDMDLKSSQLPSDSALRSSVTRLALSCWSRHEQTEEQSSILDMVYKNVANGDVNAARVSALMVCTSILSSLDSLLN
ncbi:MAG: hypothetical protein ACXWRZ_13560 [Bdellovibrio sp.]